MSNKKKIIIPIAVILGVVIVFGGVFAVLRLRRDPVSVYAASDFTMYDNSANENYTSGIVYTDNLQSVLLSETQTVTEILVTEGQTVKSGDALLKFDTTLTNLQLEQKDLKIKQLERDLQRATKEYNQLLNYRARSVSTVSARSIDTADASFSLASVSPVSDALRVEPLAPAVTGLPSAEPVENTSGPLIGKEPIDGTVETYYLYGGSGSPDEPYIYIFTDEFPFEDNFIEAILSDKSEAYTVFVQTEGDRTDGVITAAWGICYAKNLNGKNSFTLFDASEYVGLTPDGEVVEPTDEPTDAPTDEPTDEPNDEPTDEPTDEPNDEPNVPNTPSGPTASELEQMKAEKQREIRDLNLDIRMERLEYQRMQKEMEDGTVYAEISGTVSAIGDPATAYQNNEPVLKVSGSGGYYVEGAVSELKLDSIRIGQEVTVNSWATGTVCQGTIESVSTYPSDNMSFYSNSNPNVTYYSFTVFIEESAGLQVNDSVDITFTTDDSDGDSFYLEKPFILQDNGKSFVYVRNEDGRLEKREVSVGNDLWGSYSEIRGGLTQDDYIAFPYGKNVVEGAKTVESTRDEFYGY